MTRDHDSEIDREKREIARRTMLEFAQRTGVTGPETRLRRYLWTDAFAVCNFLELQARDCALRLVDQVHATLGRHRADDHRKGWISGLAEDEGRAHPTRGGLRIGKPLQERAPGAAFDERLEWDRDGQYFHYLTKWMHALARVAHAERDERFLQWAVELALAAHAGFTRAPAGAGRARMVWKMSIDLTRPLVPSMGQHDPLDGLLTFRELQSAARRARWADALEGPISRMRAMCAGASWATADPLGLGGLLCDVYRLVQLAREEPTADASLLRSVVSACHAGLSAVVAEGALEGPAAQRLAFRELGLAIGLHAIARLGRIAEQGGADAPGDLPRQLELLRAFVPIADALQGFWLDPAQRSAESWRAHLDINEVMLATSLAPGEFLAI